jgi:hypothetical protein
MAAEIPVDEVAPVNFRLGAHAGSHNRLIGHRIGVRLRDGGIPMISFGLVL